jgi:kinesin family protein 5
LAETKSEPKSDVTKFVGDNSVVVANEQYTFDKVLRGSATQEEVFNACVPPTAISDIFAGYNFTVFAYGQSSTGKTHSIMGYESDGILPRMVNKLFDKMLAEENNDIQYSVTLSYIEIYMEKVRDLLNINEDNLKIREGGCKKGVWIQGVVEQPVSSYEDCMNFVRMGNSNRVVGETKLNSRSSRSHSVCMLTVSKLIIEEGKRTESKLVIVDLAGSEKVSKTGATGTTLVEAQYTNKSLTSLGIVIKALSEKASHIPYRDSKLTRILTDSLGGNSKTSLLITCSPAESNVQETLSTLKFGSRTKLIANKPYANVDVSIEEYRRMVESYTTSSSTSLEAENAELRAEVERLTGRIDALLIDLDMKNAELETRRVEFESRTKEVKIVINTDTIAHKLLENKDEYIKVLSAGIENANAKLINQRAYYENIIHALKRNGMTILPIKSPRKV